MHKLSKEQQSDFLSLDRGENTKKIDWVNFNKFVLSGELHSNPISVEQNNRDHYLLHGVTLAMILDFLIAEYGFEELGELIRIKCFTSNPSKESSLKFLRKTEWARLQLQGLYIRTVIEKSQRK